MFFRTQPPGIDPEAVTEAVENPHDRQILAVAQDRPVEAGEIIEVTGISKSTVYRRIQRLQDLDLLEVHSGVLREGHPIDRYRATVAMAGLVVEEGTVEARWRVLETPDERLFRLWDQLRGDV